MCLALSDAAFACAAEVARRLLDPWVAESGPGGAIVLFDASGLRHEAYAGFASIPGCVAFGPETALRYASISKHMLATLLLKSGLDLERPLGDGLPELRPALAGVSLGRALDMTGGVPDLMETAWLLGVPFTAGADRAGLLAFAAGLGALNYPAGTEFSYSNTGWRLAEHLLDRRGLPLGPSLDRMVFQPLGLAIRFPTDETEPVPGLADGYWRAETDGRWRRGRYGMHFSGSGGLAGTPRDLARWLAALLAGAPPLRGVLEALTAPRPLADGRNSSYGLGLARLRLGEEELVGHGGSLPGYKNHVLMAPARGAGVVVACNREDADPLGMALAVMGGLLGTPPAPDAEAPRGLFAEAEGPGWLELTGPDAVFLGAQERLIAGTPGRLETRPAYLPMSLRREGEVIAGEVGYAPRRFLPVPPDAAAPQALAGTWRCADHCAEIEVTVRDGEAYATLGTGPLRVTSPLRPLGGDRALLERAHGPWRQRACLWLRGAGTLRLVTQRSRVLDFQRI